MSGLRSGRLWIQSGRLVDRGGDPLDGSATGTSSIGQTGRSRSVLVLVQAFRTSITVKAGVGMRTAQADQWGVVYFCIRVE